MPNLCEEVEEDLERHSLAGAFFRRGGKVGTFESHQLADVCNVSGYCLHSLDPTAEWKNPRPQKAYFVTVSRVSYSFPVVFWSKPVTFCNKNSLPPLESIDRQAIHPALVCTYPTIISGNRGIRRRMCSLRVLLCLTKARG